MRSWLFAVLVPAAMAAALAGEPATSDTCGRCHRDIYRMWRDSIHAEAAEDPFFFETYRATLDRGQIKQAKICLSCHAPFAAASGDMALSKSLNREGVNCEFCHSLTAVEITDRGPKHRLDVGSVKRGTIAEADSPAHGVAYSELHKSAKVCAPCHEYVSENGVAILTTYSEWTASGAAKAGKTCQTCHMAQTTAEVVDPKVARQSAARVNLHEMPGGHSIHQLLDALDVKVRSTRAADAIDVEVAITNTGAGHAVPTGMPGRRILLVVQVDAGAGTTEERRSYGKSFRSASGGKLTHVSDYFGADVELASDSRIAADEVRRETFRFPMTSSAPAYVTVKMHYEHAPSGDQGEKEWLTFFVDRKLVKRG